MSLVYKTKCNILELRLRVNDLLREGGFYPLVRLYLQITTVTIRIGINYVERVMRELLCTHVVVPPLMRWHTILECPIHSRQIFALNKVQYSAIIVIGNFHPNFWIEETLFSSITKPLSSNIPWYTRTDVSRGGDTRAHPQRCRWRAKSEKCTTAEPAHDRWQPQADTFHSRSIRIMVSCEQVNSHPHRNRWYKLTQIFYNF